MEILIISVVYHYVKYIALTTPRYCFIRSDGVLFLLMWVLSLLHNFFNLCSFIILNSLFSISLFIVIVHIQTRYMTYH